MRNRDEPAAAVLAEIDLPSVVSAREGLSEFDILAFGLVEQAQGRVDEGGFKAFRLDSGQPFFWIHRPEGSGNSIPGSLMPSALARRAHRAESRQSGAIKDFREPAADFEMLLAAIVLAYPHRAGFVFGLDVTIPQCRVFQHVAVRVNRALVLQFVEFFLFRHRETASRKLRMSCQCSYSAGRRGHKAGGKR